MSTFASKLLLAPWALRQLGLAGFNHLILECTLGERLG